MAHTAASRREFRNRSETQEAYFDYGVCDPAGRKIGRVKEFFTNARGEPEYILVRVGFFGLRSVLVPVGFVSVDEGRRTLTLH